MVNCGALQVASYIMTGHDRRGSRVQHRHSHNTIQRWTAYICRLQHILSHLFAVVHAHSADADVCQTWRAHSPAEAKLCPAPTLQQLYQAVCYVPCMSTHLLEKQATVSAGGKAGSVQGSYEVRSVGSE